MARQSSGRPNTKYGPQPTAPTGRLVGGVNTTNGKGSTQAIQTLHWLPNAKRTGVYSWKCPDCGQWFAWSVDLECWVVSTPEAAMAGQST